MSLPLCVSTNEPVLRDDPRGPWIRNASALPSSRWSTPSLYVALAAVTFLSVMLSRPLKPAMPAWNPARSSIVRPPLSSAMVCPVEIEAPISRLPAAALPPTASVPIPATAAPIVSFPFATIRPSLSRMPSGDPAMLIVVPAPALMTPLFAKSPVTKVVPIELVTSDMSRARVAAPPALPLAVATVPSFSLSPTANKLP